MERREACRGGRETNKKSTHSQTSTKGSTAAQRPHSSHNARRNDVSTANPTNQAAKVAKPSAGARAGAGGPAYDEQV